MKVTKITNKTKRITVLYLLFALTLGFSSFVSADATGVDETMDHKAQIFNAQGDVKVLKKGAPDWNRAEKGAVIDEGDQLLTAAGAFVEVVYDSAFLNIARIEEKTKAEFRSIEPTDLHLEDGTIFSALDGMKAGQEYKVSTPVAVAAVRGTHFDVVYDAASKVMEAAVIPDEKPHVSRLEITPMLPDGGQGNAFMIDEGQQINLQPEKLSEGSGVQPEPIDASRMQENQNRLDQMMSAIQEGGEPPLAGDDQHQLPGNGNPPSGGSGPDGLGAGPVQDGTVLGSGLTRSANADALADSLIPRTDVPSAMNQPPAGMEGVRPGADKQPAMNEKTGDSGAMTGLKRDRSGMTPMLSGDVKNNPAAMTQAAGVMKPGDTAGMMKPREGNVGTMMEFLSTGGAFKNTSAPIAGTNPAGPGSGNPNFGQLLGNLGMQRNEAQKMGDVLTNMTTAPPSGTPGAVTAGAPMDHMNPAGAVIPGTADSNPAMMNPAMMTAGAGGGVMSPEMMKAMTDPSMQHMSGDMMKNIAMDPSQIVDRPHFDPSTLIGMNPASFVQEFIQNNNIVNTAGLTEQQIRDLFAEFIAIRNQHILQGVLKDSGVGNLTFLAKELNDSVNSYDAGQIHVGQAGDNVTMDLNNLVRAPDGTVVNLNYSIYKDGVLRETGSATCSSSQTCTSAPSTSG